RVWMSVPLRVTYVEAERFARENLRWIAQQREKIKHTCPVDTNLQTGTVLRLWGQPIQLQIEPAQSGPAVVREDDALRLFVPAQDGPAACRAALESWFRAQLTIALQDVCKRWELVVGQRASSYHIRKMKTRWGSCSLKTRRICVNEQLVHEPPEWLGYVVVHELTHFLVPNHSQAFWTLMDGFYPNWRTIRRYMRK
ncbi:MAG: M48 family metallopeptidase, partial [Intestinibacillus sp.]